MWCVRDIGQKLRDRITKFAAALNDGNDVIESIGAQQIEQGELDLVVAFVWRDDLSNKISAEDHNLYKRVFEKSDNLTRQRMATKM